MPIYEYECSNCGCQKEVWQHFSDKPMTKCEICKGTMKKLISQSTFHLKGSGWYVTDYASKGRTDGEKETSAKDKETTSKETKGTSDSAKKASSSTKEKKTKD